MKFRVAIERGSSSAAHTLEISINHRAAESGGRVRFIWDGKVGEADWAVIRPGVYSLIIAGDSREARVRKAEPGRSGDSYEVMVGSERLRIALQDSRAWRRAAPAAVHGSQEVLAPMPGRVAKILVAENASVEAGQGLLVIEAMKMQNELRAPRAGRVEKIHVGEGDGVETGTRLMVLV